MAANSFGFAVVQMWALLLDSVKAVSSMRGRSSLVGPDFFGRQKRGASVFSTLCGTGLLDAARGVTAPGGSTAGAADGAISDELGDAAGLPRLACCSDGLCLPDKRLRAS